MFGDPSAFVFHPGSGSSPGLNKSTVVSDPLAVRLDKSLEDIIKERKTPAPAPAASSKKAAKAKAAAPAPATPASKKAGKKIKLCRSQEGGQRRRKDDWDAVQKNKGETNGSQTKSDAGKSQKGKLSQGRAESGQGCT